MSDYKIKEIDFSSLDKDSKIVIIASEFNREYTSALEEINEKFLKKYGFTHIKKYLVPWALEIPGMAHKILKNKKVDLILTFGVVVKWETPHFDYVCENAARGIMDLTIKYETPIIFGVLTCNNFEQVQTRISDTYAISGLKILLEYNKI